MTYSIFFRWLWRYLTRGRCPVCHGTGIVKSVYSLFPACCPDCKGTGWEPL